MHNINMEVYMNILINDDILDWTKMIEIKEKNAVKGQQEKWRTELEEGTIFPQSLIPVLN